ncbi:MAG: glycoside hydrolase N-terminal domain-containing protein, partial [Bacteroidetes bacterium]|nr:glycoside hydrolase N-terminal domain-containing protein [Bacteroidota bacterium]
MKFLAFLTILLAPLLSNAQQELWYDRPADKWTDALPIGNGHMGGMVFGGVGTDRIQFNESTLWTGRPREYQHNGAVQYLAQIRALLAAGQQKEAEALAEKEFLGRKDPDEKEYAARKQEWIRLVRADTIAAAKEYDDNDWAFMPLPAWNGWESIGFDGLDGALWFSNTFEYEPGWSGKDIILDLGRIRDDDFTYVNGHLIGSTRSNDKRNYIVPAAFLKPGRNTITIQVLNYFDKGGLVGSKDAGWHFKVYPADDRSKPQQLSGRWKY